MSPILRWIFTVALLLAGASTPAAQDHEHRASPFDALRWSDGQPEVQVEQVWYRPRTIDGVAVEDILALCRERWPGRVEKRFAEDLMEALALLGVTAGDAVTLELVRLPDGEEVILEDVPNTNAKRSRLRDSGNAPLRSVSGPVDLTQAQALADVAAFEAGLRERFAYLELLDFDWEQELERLRAELDEPISADELAARLNRLLLRFGDGHASVTSGGRWAGQTGPFLPFLMADSSAGVVAFEADREAFLDSERPLVVSLAGFPLEECLGAVRAEVVDGSPQVVRLRSLELLRDVSLWYPALASGAEPPREIEVQLAKEAGKKKRKRDVELTLRKPTYGDWPRTASRLLAGSFGYLRLSSMDDAAVDEVHRWMPEFADTRGLVVDVRGNGGGSRAALLALAGYLTGPEDEPWVGNVAAYRLAPGFDADHLEARFMYRAGDGVWSEAQAQVIERVRAMFAPEWPPPAGFSEWHYLVLDRTGQAGEYAYEAPVVVLADAGCFSATDIFLGALELHPRVTLVGTASGGGSARSQSFVLPASGIEVRCASMASFRPDGRLYDRRGVEVDVEVQPVPGFFLTGGEDNALEAAVGLLEESGR